MRESTDGARGALIEHHVVTKLPIIDGCVRCHEQQSWVDIERCLACPALRSVAGRAHVLTCVNSRWGARSAAAVRAKRLSDSATLASALSITST